MDFSKTVIFVLAILFVILESDVGRKKVGWFRIARPIVVAGAIVPIYFKNLPTSSNDLLFQGVALLAGILLGLIVVSPLFVSVGVDPEYRSMWQRRRGRPGTPAAVSVAGFGYAMVWIVFSVARIAFAYGSRHWFPHGLEQFLSVHSLSADALTNALIFLSLGMDVFRSLGLWGRASSAMHRDQVEVQVSEG